MQFLFGFKSTVKDKRAQRSAFLRDGFFSSWFNAMLFFVDGALFFIHVIRPFGTANLSSLDEVSVDNSVANSFNGWPEKKWKWWQFSTLWAQSGKDRVGYLGNLKVYTFEFGAISVDVYSSDETRCYKSFQNIFFYNKTL